jgi:hypothetical protein
VLPQHSNVEPSSRFSCQEGATNSRSSSWQSCMEGKWRGNYRARETGSSKILRRAHRDTEAHKQTTKTWRMVSFGMLRSVALVRTDVSEELRPSFFRVTRIGEIGTTLAVTSNRRTAVTMKNGIFWDVTLCGSCKNRRFGGTYRLQHQGDKNRCSRNVSRN